HRVSLVGSATAQIGRIDERSRSRSRRIDFGYERIGRSSGGNLCSILGGEVGGEGVSDHIDISGRIYTDPIALIAGASAEVGGVRQRRVNDKGAARVVFTHRKAHFSACCEKVASAHPLSLALALLIAEGSMLAQLSGARLKQQIPVGGNLKVLDASKGQAD